MIASYRSRHRIRRIVVALDTSVDSDAALRASAQLAARLEAELIGLYVEDADLLRLAEHPSASEVEYFSARRRQLTGPELERQLRSQAAQLRRRLMRIADRLGVRSSFRTARGRVAARLLASLEEADLIGVGARGRSRTRGPGSTVETLLGEGSGPLLVLRSGMSLGGHIHVLYDGSDGAEAALELGFDLAQDEDTELTVILESPVGERERLAGAVRDRLEERRLDAKLLYLPKHAAGPDLLVYTLRQSRAGLLVTTRESLRYDRRELGRFLSRLHCPLLVAGSGGRVSESSS